MEGQKILFKTVTITPTLIAAEIEYDENNSKKIFGYDDIAIINEEGTNQYIGYAIASETKFKSPIYLTITDYPSLIKGDFKVKIK